MRLVGNFLSPYVRRVAVSLDCPTSPDVATQIVILGNMLARFLKYAATGAVARVARKWHKASCSL
jgi:hypothetical protein